MKLYFVGQLLENYEQRINIQASTTLRWERYQNLLKTPILFGDP